MRPAPLAYDKPLCASLDGFTLHAATRAAGFDAAGKEALLRYVLRPPLAQERVQHQPDGLVRIALKRAFADGTVPVEMDPLSLLCRLATAVPPPRHLLREVRERGTKVWDCSPDGEQMCFWTAGDDYTETHRVLIGRVSRGGTTLTPLALDRRRCR